METLRKRIAEDDGAVLVIVAMVLVVVIGMAALVVDLGALYQARADAQNAADAGALAGVGALTPVGGIGASGVSGKAKGAAESITVSNGAKTAAAMVSSTYFNQDTIEVTANEDVTFRFAGIFGLSTRPVTGVSSAVVRGPVGYNAKVMPFAIAEAEARQLTYGTVETVKAGGGDSDPPGRFGIADWTDDGGNPDEAQSVIGSGGKASAKGDVMFAVPGNKNGPIAKFTRDYVAGEAAAFESVIGPPNDAGASRVNNLASKRIFVVPVVEGGTLSKNGPMNVTGFAWFYITRVECSGAGTDTAGEIEGRFFKPALTKAAAAQGGVIPPGAWTGQATEYSPAVYQLLR